MEMSELGLPVDIVVIDSLMEEKKKFFLEAGDGKWERLTSKE